MIGRHVDLVAVATCYQQASDLGESPTVLVMQRFGASRTTVGRWLAEARRQGLLPVTTPGRALAHKGLHQPARVRWVNNPQGSWLACQTCRVPWPCNGTTDA